MRGELRDEAPAEPLLEQELVDIERLALSLANLAGAEILTALGGMHAVRYKTLSDDANSTWRDPVSEIDEQVERLIRTRLADEFPRHDVIGEEMDDRPGRHGDFIWAIDPIDGTANFVNGFPLFAASIGVLYRGEPIAGAVWCSTSHKLRSGVYHARRGGALHFNSEAIKTQNNPSVRRSLAGVPATLSGKFPWESRKTGSAAIECAFTAAGLLRVAKFEHPNLWDVAGGIPLVLAAGGIVYEKTDAGWTRMDRFEGPSSKEIGDYDLGIWRRPLIVGAPEAVLQYCAFENADRAGSDETSSPSSLFG